MRIDHVIFMGNDSRAQQKLQKLVSFAKIGWPLFYYQVHVCLLMRVLTVIIYLLEVWTVSEISISSSEMLILSKLISAMMFAYETVDRLFVEYLYVYIYMEAKVRSFLPVISPCRLSRQHHWTQKNRKKDCKLLYVHSLLYYIDPWDKISVFLNTVFMTKIRIRQILS